MLTTRIVALHTALAMILCSFPQTITASEKSKEKKETSVAIVPYDYAFSPEIDKAIKNIESSLREQPGVYVRDRKTTNEILSYYLDHVDSTAHDGESAELLRDARQAYQEANYAAASQKLDAAEGSMRQEMAKGKSNALMSDLLILKAKLAYVGGKKDEAAKIYDEIARLNPDLEFSEGLYSGWEHKALAAAKKKLSRTARLDIQSDPKSSEIYINGVHKGITLYDKPYVIENFPAGNHCVELRTIHYETYVNCFAIADGETKHIDAKLKRIAIASGKEIAVVPPNRFSTAHELSALVSGLGYYMGVDKVILVHGQSGDVGKALAYQIGDSSLGAVNKVSTLDGKKGASLALLTKEMRSELQRDVLSNPGDQLISQSVGSIQLHETRRTPIYKRPVFWILAGAGAAAGGIAAAILGVGAAAATTGGIIIGL